MFLGCVYLATIYLLFIHHNNKYFCDDDPSAQSWGQKVQMIACKFDPCIYLSLLHPW